MFIKKKYLIILIIVFSVVTFLAYKYYTKPAFTPYGYGFRSQISSAQGEIANFSLLDHNGVFHELYRLSDASAVVIISQGNDCPIIQRYSQTLLELEKKYKNANVKFFLLNSNRQDDRESIIKEAKNYGIRFPILLDQSQLVAEVLGITRTAEVVVLDPKSWSMIYRGAIDDRFNYGADKQVSRNKYLISVLDSVLKNESIKVVAQPAKGCLITFEKKRSISYVNDVAPIIRSRCMNCHASGTGILPTFDGYESIKNWSQMSKDTILTGRMPPFSADLHYKQYKNNIGLTPEEKWILVNWINAGALKDKNAKDPLKNILHDSSSARAKLRGYEKVLTVRTPKEYVIPAEGNNEYVYQQVGEQIQDDFWVTALDMKTTNPRQLHHVALMVVSHPLSYYEKISEEKRKNYLAKHPRISIDGDVPIFTLNTILDIDDGPNPNYVRAQIWAAGKFQPMFFNKNISMFIPKGSYLVLESHYMGTGKVETERTEIDFYSSLRKSKIAPRQLKIKTINRNFFTVPAFTSEFNVDTIDWTIDRDIYVFSVLGHLHMRGKALKLFAQTPDQKERVIIDSIPNFYYGWHTGAGLVYEQPILYKKGTIFSGICTFDNSPQNPNNPDPSRAIPWGQRVDRSEMCRLLLSYYDAK